MRIILASDSPRRKQLLSLLGLKFSAVSHAIDEQALGADNPEDLVGQLALAKALSVKLPAKGLVIGSDLVVVLGKRIFGKPKNITEAKRFLKTLSGRTHTVYCAVCATSRDKTLMSVAQSQVKMKNYDEKIINDYVKKFAVLDKGGAYAIQFQLPGYGSLVKSFKGGITTIIGLPLDYLENLLKEFGVKVKTGWRQRCKIETGYDY